VNGPMSSPTLYDDASSELIEQIRQIENQCDKWTDSLALGDFTYDVAAWGALTSIIDLIERQIEQYGHGSWEQRDAMSNLGRAGALLLDTLSKRQLPPKQVWLRWTQQLKEASAQAIEAARQCDGFIGCFTLWHQNRQAVEILSPTRLRFSVPSSPMDRRVRAYQQGRRIPNWPSTPDNPFERSFVNEPHINQMLSQLSSRVALEGALAISYPGDSELLSALRDILEERYRLRFRHSPLLDLGGYDLGNFGRFFAGLSAMCAVHEYLCDDWRKRQGRFPFESAVMVKASAEWTSSLADLCSLDENQVRMMIKDLTLGTTKALDLLIHPFASSLDSQTLYLVPHFVQIMKPEESILRICASVRPKCYKPIANAKEDEMRERLSQNVPNRYRVVGSKKLPNPLPDIDMLIKDSRDSVILVGELKWVRQPVRAIDQMDKNAELEEGFGQLHEVREFLRHNPDYLKECGVTERGEHPPTLSYAVIARDHITNTLEKDGLWLAEFDSLGWALSNSASLTDAIRRLQSYEWLPLEGRDFAVRFEAGSIAGVTMESEAFHRMPKASGE
jgi:hypothetical protein